MNLIYCAWIIANQDRRATRFEVYVHERDARWERYVERTDAGLNRIHDRLGQIEAKR